MHYYERLTSFSTLPQHKNAQFYQHRAYKNRSENDTRKSRVFTGSILVYRFYSVFGFDLYDVYGKALG